MGGRSSSSTSQQITSTQIDKRVAATDSAQVAQGGSKIRNDSRTNIKVSSADSKVIKAALKGIRAPVEQAFAFSTKAQASGAKLVERAISSNERALNKVSAAQAGIDGLKPILLAGVAAVGLFAFLRR